MLHLSSLPGAETNRECNHVSVAGWESTYYAHQALALPWRTEASTLVLLTSSMRAVESRNTRFWDCAICEGCERRREEDGIIRCGRVFLGDQKKEPSNGSGSDIAVGGRSGPW